ncbi:hypothetical protein ACM1RC_12335 [Paenibacillus azoreducens]|uniref:hypothetical protein n=1 Tax=Paenibacillus azoreducens TaxID=116718 RepID=UPI0039F6025F
MNQQAYPCYILGLMDEGTDDGEIDQIVILPQGELGNTGCRTSRWCMKHCLSLGVNIRIMMKRLKFEVWHSIQSHAIIGLHNAIKMFV